MLMRQFKNEIQLLVQRDIVLNNANNATILGYIHVNEFFNLFL